MKSGTKQPIVEEAYRIELAGGKKIVRAAATAVGSLDVFILSALSAAKDISNAKYQHIYHFDAKAEVVKYLEDEFPILVENTAILQLGMFATNWSGPTPLYPTRASLRRACFILTNVFGSNRMANTEYPCRVLRVHSFHSSIPTQTQLCLSKL
jgi:NmrA-like family